MIERFYISITGQQQGLISKNCSSEMSIGDKCNPEHLDEITVHSFAYPEFDDRNPTPLYPGSFTITKYIDSATPLLFNAWKNGEILSCEISVFQESQNSKVKTHTLKLEEAEIRSLDINAPDKQLGADSETVEHIRIRALSSIGTNHGDLI